MIAAAASLAAVSSPARAVNTVYFSTADAGVTKSVATWGVDTAWPSYDNVRQSIQNIGAANVDQVRVTFEPLQPLVNTNGVYSLNATAKAGIDAQLSLGALAGYKPITLVAGATAGGTYDATNWVRTIKATQEYINSKTGWTNVQIKAIETFNEPDYWTGEGTPADLNSAIATLKNYGVFRSTTFLAASTLNSDNARFWYDRVPNATAGSSHLLGGSLSSYVGFIDYVNGTGKPFINPELHSLGEAIVGAQHGMAAGNFWADVLRARGLFVQASDGKQLGYYEDLARQSAAAVYRAPNGKMYAFAGGVERFGRATSYRFVSTDKDVYFNGIPVREYMLQTKWDQTDNATAAGGDDFQNFGSWSGQGAYADIETDAASAVPALDGYRWKIVNAATGQVLEIANSSTANGAAVRTANDTNGLNQKWNIVRTRNGYLELFNANSGLTMDVLNGSLSSGGKVDQWGTADNQIQQWYIEPGANGQFYLRNAYSNLYLQPNTTQSTQQNFLGTASQQWKFVLANPNAGPKARYTFENTANDVAATNHGVTSGNPTYTPGPSGQGNALRFDGVDDSVQLPTTVSHSNDITLSTWVKWDGGNAWQRIFDFGSDTTKYMFLTPSSGDGTMRFAITTTGTDGEQALETSALPMNQWVHLALTIGGNTGILYVDGKARVAGQILLNPTDVNATLNYLGKSQFADPLFKGVLDDFRVYDYALTQLQVAGLLTNTWANDADGNWIFASSWSYGAVPNGAGQSATFAGPLTATRTATLGAATTLGTLNFNASTGVNLVGTSTLTFETLTGSAAINVNAGANVIRTPVSFADDVLVSVASGASLDLTNTTDGGGHALTKTGTGLLQLAQLRNTALNVQAGTVRLATHTASSTVAGTSQLTGVSIANGAQLDLTNNALAIDYAPGTADSVLSQLRLDLAAGRITGGASGVLAIGYADNAALHRSTLGDVAVDDSTVLIQLALLGDSDLSGSVDFADLLNLAKNYNAAGVWQQGDFDYNGTVGFTDLLALAKNYNATLSAADADTLGASIASEFALAQSLVPEPATLGLLLAAGSLTGTRRRR